MNAFRAGRWCRLSQWMSGTRIYRWASQAMLRAQCRMRLKRIDACQVDRSQLVALQGMVHRARGTLFGQDHDFRRIESVRDYQRLVPLTTPQALWSRYWRITSPEPALAT